MFVKQEAPSISVQANKQKSRVALGDKVDLVFKTWDGDELKVVGYLGETVMVRQSFRSSPRHFLLWVDSLTPLATE